MSEITKSSLEKILPQLKCHFTWNLFKEKDVLSHLNDRVCNQIELLSTEFKATMYNLLAYLKHLQGQNDAALECLQQAEELIQQEHPGQAEIQSMVTWGNYAWIYYYMDQLEKAQTYVDKVKQVCVKFSNPYSIECPELDSEEGWTQLKCGRNERAKICFAKALEEKPDNPEFSSGLAIAVYQLDAKPWKQFPDRALRQAIELSPENQYLKVLLALKLQKTNEEAEAEQLIEEALEKAPQKADVLQTAGKFYRKKGNLDKAIELFLRALDSTPNNSYLYFHIICCYRDKIMQLQKTGESEAKGDREKIEELRALITKYINKVTEEKSDFLNIPCDFTEFEKAEECYQRVFRKGLPSANEQQLHPDHSHTHEYYSKSTDTTVENYLESFVTSKMSSEKEEMKHSTAKNLPPQNAPNCESLQGLNGKLDGDLPQAVECEEKERGHLRKEAALSIGSAFAPTSEPEEGSEEMCQDAGSSTCTRLPHS
ncbi:interferon-induced protein with tetratricopeptide repeats 3 [Cavia porcellus]|uniref:Interferon induced protein with tetratricopeptide repeats 3 n=1 Tax=Cavia porcellus TaxID=10141 RepID=A0A286XYV7_CAVPO|nr:interferon-induced protein with tetratricopeptide repeats 3 [Cavia porcellus]